MRVLIILALIVYSTQAWSDAEPVCEPHDLDSAKKDSKAVFLGVAKKIQPNAKSKKIQFEVVKAWKGNVKGLVWLNQNQKVTDDYGELLAPRKIEINKSYLLFVKNNDVIAEGCGWMGLADTPMEGAGTAFLLDNGPISSLTLDKIPRALRAGGTMMKYEVLIRLLELVDQGEKTGLSVLDQVIDDKRVDSSVRGDAAQGLAYRVVNKEAYYPRLLKLLMNNNKEIAESTCHGVLETKGKSQRTKTKLMNDLEAEYKRNKRKYDMQPESWTPNDAIDCLLNS